MKQITQIFLEGESPTLKRLVRRRKITKIQLSQELNVWPNCLSVHLRTKWLRVRDPLQSLKIQISQLFRAKSSLTFRQLESVDLA